jgi:hypothetical protein
VLQHCGGLILGGLAFAVSKLIWLVVLVPIGFGTGAGGLLSRMIGRRSA